MCRESLSLFWKSLRYLAIVGHVVYFKMTLLQVWAMQKCLSVWWKMSHATNTHTLAETGSVRKLPLLMRLSFPFHESYNVSVKRLKNACQQRTRQGDLLQAQVLFQLKGDPPSSLYLTTTLGRSAHLRRKCKNSECFFRCSPILWYCLLFFETNVCCVFSLGLPVLQLKLQQRRTREELVSQGIMPRM